MAPAAAVLVPSAIDPTAPMPAGVWLVTLLLAPDNSLSLGLKDEGGGLSPLGQVVTSIWNGIAHETPGLTLGDFAVWPDGLQALLYVPWEGSSRTVGAIVARFKSLVVSTAGRAGLLLESALWQSGFDGRLIQDPLELAVCRSNIRANQR